MKTDRAQIQPAKQLAQSFARAAGWLDEIIEAKAEGDPNAARALEEQWEITVTTIVNLHKELGKLLVDWDLVTGNGVSIEWAKDHRNQPVGFGTAKIDSIVSTVQVNTNKS